MAQADSAASPDPAKATGQQLDEAKPMVKIESNPQLPGDTLMAYAAEADTGTAAFVASSVSLDFAGLPNASKPDPEAVATALPTEDAQVDNPATKSSLAPPSVPAQHLSSEDPPDQQGEERIPTDPAAQPADTSEVVPQNDAPNMRSSAVDHTGNSTATAGPVASQLQQV